jgi:hypothetical protein
LYRSILCSLPVLFLAACSTEPAKPVEPVAAEPLKPVTGRSAFYKVFPVARQWAPDAQGLQLASIYLAEAPAGPSGTAPAWQAIFASKSKAKMKTFTWSVMDAPGNLKKGVFQSDEQEFSGKLDQALPFFPQALHIDSDEAYKSATAKPDKQIAANAKLPVNYLLEYVPSRFGDLTWRVMWGETVGTAAYSVFVDASTGAAHDKAH